MTMYNKTLTIKRRDNKSLYTRLNRIAGTRKHSIFLVVCPGGVDTGRDSDGQWSGGTVDYTRKVTDGCALKNGYFCGKPATPVVSVSLAYCAKHFPDVLADLPSEYQVAADSELEGVQR